MATVSCGTTSERFEFVQRYRKLGVTWLCKFLEVSKSGFYDWCKRQPAKRHAEDQALLKLITQVFEKSEGRYGSPRVYKTLRKQGVRTSKKRAERLMREAGLQGRVYCVTKRIPGLRRFQMEGDNILGGMDMPTETNQVWVADVTYIKADNRWCYLATVMDLFSRRIIGWSLARNRTTDLTSAALLYALKNRGYPKGVVFHTDRGVEFLGSEFQKHLDKYEFIHSRNRAGHCTDNAFMESFYHSLKGELIRGNQYKSEKELRRSLMNYINKFYNLTRLHSGLDYESLIEYEESKAA